MKKRSERSSSSARAPHTSNMEMLRYELATGKRVPRWKAEKYFQQPQPEPSIEETADCEKALALLAAGDADSVVEAAVLASRYCATEHVPFTQRYSPILTEVLSRLSAYTADPDSALRHRIVDRVARERAHG